MVLSKYDLKKCLSKGDLVIKPLDEKNHLGPCDVNLRISKNYTRIKDAEQILDIYDITDESLNNKYFMLEESEKYIIRPNEHLLIESLEYLEVPTYLTAFIVLRSTFSRLGLNTPPTTIDPGFKGKIVCHLIGSSYPIKLYAGIAVFKVIFIHVPSNTSAYNGKYQNQRGIVLAKSDSTWKRGK